MDKTIINVTETTGMKIRDYLTKRIGFSTSLIAKVKYDGVFLNGIAVHMRAIVKDGDVIEVNMPKEDSDIEPMDIPLKVLYEDEDILVVDKPINMPMHPAKGNSLPTLANAVRHYIGAPFVFRSITRLDRDTSGIVLIAKNQLASAILSRDQKKGLFTKTYMARVVGQVDEYGLIDAPIERIAEGDIKRIVRDDGKPAKTEYVRVSSDGDTSIVRINLLTGRTHQIRVHFAHIGHPLYNDFLYGERVVPGTYSLRCGELSFPHPKTKEIIKITTDFEEEL